MGSPEVMSELVLASFATPEPLASARHPNALFVLA